MSFLSDFEGRIGSIFGAAPQGFTEPFSFKKLAKRAAREMESETYEIDGVDTAPAVYTVLVSSTDDAIMRPLYAQITTEICDFIKAQAQRKDYVFVGEPVVRFMVDPELRSGRFSVFADNVDSRTLTRLREEERAFLGGNVGFVGGAAALRQHSVPGQPRSRAAMPQVQTPLGQPLPTQRSLSDSEAGLDVMPSDFDDLSQPVPVASSSASTPMPVSAMATPLVTVAPGVDAAPVPQTRPRGASQAPDPLQGGAGTSDPTVSAAPNVPLVSPTPFGGSAGANRPATCMLIERQTGRTFTGTAPSCVIGRERASANVVLRDPNVSRRHAELTYDGRDWHIVDLRSTNGTLVNDIDVDECVLRDGDLITVGLVNLEFREVR